MFFHDSFSDRSKTYRRMFFTKNRPVIGRIYFCAYCGKPCTEKRITVDHLYPVNKAKRNRRLRKRLKRKGFTDINDIRNLVPACRRCNTKKGTKTGLWIIRGEIGRHQIIWIPIHIIRIIIFICFLLFLHQAGYI